MELYDIGVNLAKGQFDRDRDAVVARARAAGVTRMALTGTDADASVAAAEMAGAMGFVSTAGVHPHNASRWEEEAARIADLLDLPQVRAVGECGLDFDRNHSPPDAQRRAFEAQLRLAADLRMPLFLHERAAEAEMRAMLAAMGPDLPPAVLHCFTGGPETLEGYLALGLSVGITGWLCDERRGEDLRAAVPLIPAGRLMLETDAPYLFPRSMPIPEGGAKKPSRNRNEPANLPWVAAEAARLRGESVEALAAHSTAAALAFFEGGAARTPG